MSTGTNPRIHWWLREPLSWESNEKLPLYQIVHSKSRQRAVAWTGQQRCHDPEGSWQNDCLNLIIQNSEMSMHLSVTHYAAIQRTIDVCAQETEKNWSQKLKLNRKHHNFMCCSKKQTPTRCADLFQSWKDKNARINWPNNWRNCYNIIYILQQSIIMEIN